MQIMRWAKVTHQFEGIHQYEEAPEAVAFLRYPHRHMFHVTLWLEQFHNERDVEYIMLKRWLADHLTTMVKSGNIPVTSSCETIAELIGYRISEANQGRKVKVEVTEDGENGAVLEFEA